ncbi:hypothetical protein [Mangrovibacterium diazotrophicum]|uniref:Uncharacterized protein n=1 Tax=Mangrovibacterium diazotrophicum TaxID=1261403 RepID=A0A419W551_9BACT|nr:hypothetical protein [Mangrovibacterium diazotrophicum]RKD90573.1 hypothetical protein BC643_0913 [Mangrovibacterium diazotrophicum]
MTHVESFLNELNNSIQADQTNGNKQQNTGLIQFIASTKNSLDNLQSYLDNKQVAQFYQEIGELKFMIEYSDEVHKNWLLIRAYSGALARLSLEVSMKHASDVSSYYEIQYGRRRILKEESWFEQLRWEFLDELKTLDDDAKLTRFLNKQHKKLNSCFQVYKSELMLFLESLNKQ